jgi:hypothetical protein
MPGSGPFLLGGYIMGNPVRLKTHETILVDCAIEFENLIREFKGGLPYCMGRDELNARIGQWVSLARRANTYVRTSTKVKGIQS